jgi:geranylgeranyl pyrophosphate synthase
MSRYSIYLINLEKELQKFITINFSNSNSNSQNKNENENENLDDMLVKVDYMLNGGKRIRPILGLAFNNEKTEFLILVEFIHNLSLILDDTPQMDNDIIRRNIPTFHIKYGCKETFLFAYNIIGYITEYLGKIDTKDTKDKLKKFSCNQYTSKYNIVLDELLSVIQGQYKDLNFNTEPSFIFNTPIHNKYHFTLKFLREQFEIEWTSQLEYYLVLVLEKTASLFYLAIWIAICDMEIISSNMEIITRWGYVFGIFFQICDDIIDIEKDIAKNKPNITKCMDVENCKLFASKIKDFLINEIVVLQNFIPNCDNELLKEIVEICWGKIVLC